MRLKGLIQCEPFVSEPQYLTIMGSFAYGVSSDTSDMDIYGFCIPPKERIFPHLVGHLEGFDDPFQKFEVFNHHHIQHKEKSWDLAIYSIVKYFRLAMDNNPNMVDSLYTPENCILHSTKVGDYVRNNRGTFLHKGSFHKMKGYAFSQLQKAKNKSFKILADLCRERGYFLSEDFDEIKERWEQDGVKDEQLMSIYKACVENGKPNPKRVASIFKHGWDVKFGYHLIRLVDEAEQILTTGQLNLQNAREHMKAVREGLFSLEDTERWFQEKTLHLEKLYRDSNVVPHSPDTQVIKRHLLNCLEMFYGSLERVEKQKESTVQEIITILKRDGYF